MGVWSIKIEWWCVQVFSNCLRSSGRTGIIASEEEDVPVAVEESYSGNYVVVFDPLDGSSNIDAAVSTGSIFGIYSPNDECLADDTDDIAAVNKLLLFLWCQVYMSTPRRYNANKVTFGCNVFAAWDS